MSSKSSLFFQLPVPISFRCLENGSEGIDFATSVEVFSRMDLSSAVREN